ncbi:mechanosensitive ion channel domain-containing protein [Paraglaciecola sp. MB-3u-78]|uniref:mechanosensitive ion channel domain-containing protein n=1 Tax=Paraglaciecola sp. MB-3u-78 TaxID=2058332 RepID=UPI000C33C1DE|nr:mechanosensitive ion channel domain-containing protein [Paraglaciecola sp. MB-3u-78]PKH00512.1 mechanosensitive ion channel protein MscS [Paraglaciecola sp. MB-3u-78]
MPITEKIINVVDVFLPLLLTLIIVVFILWLAHIVLIKRQDDLGNEKLFSRQLSMLGLTIAGVLTVILALPVSESSRNQIIGLVGLVISGIFAFSSSTIFANLLAGIMLRVTKPFRAGDFIQVDDFFGRVVERGLLDTEIQTEVRDLVALPNTFMITRPISVTRSSGTIIFTTLSLGYDIHHSKVDDLLTQAATNCGLTDAFIHIVELGDFSVVYKVSGKLEDVKSLISSRTRLNREVLDVLHDNQIEIMSPSYMNQRPMPDGSKVIPTKQKVKKEQNTHAVEAIVFDKAEEAEKIETEKEQIKEQVATLQQKLTDASDEKEMVIKKDIEKLNQQLSNMKVQKPNED